MNFYDKKNRRLFTRIIVIILVLALVVPYVISVLSF